MIELLSNYSDAGLLILRLAFAAIFLAHGLPKIKNLKGTGEWMASIGIKPGLFWATVVGLTETVGALCIALGLGTHLVAIAFVIDMIVAMSWRIRSGHPFVHGYEIDFLLLATALFLATNGGGAYSFDNALALW